MIKKILLFLTIIALGLAFYFYQSGFPKSLPASSQTGQVIDSQKVLGDFAEKKEVSLPEPLKVSKEWLSSNKDSIILTDSGIIKYSNKEREKQSLPGFSENKKLSASAEAKLEDMFKQQYFEHTSPQGKTMNDLAVEVNYDYILIGENLAEGDFKDDEALVSAWMASPNHRANILNSLYTEIGVAVGRGMIKDQEVWLAIQHFGRPANLCSEIDKDLKLSINQNKARIEELTQELNLGNGGAAVFLAYLKSLNKIREYNNLVEETAAKIDLYNNQVSSFNNCIQK